MSVAALNLLVTTTKMDIEEFNFQWKVDLGSLSLLKTPGFAIKSPLFTGGKKLKHSWQLELCIASPSSGSGNRGDLCFTLVSLSGTSALTENEIKAAAFASYEGALDAIDKGYTAFSKIRPSKNVSLKVPLYDFYNIAKKYLQNNVLTFYCVIVMGTDMDYSRATTETVNSSDTVVRSWQTAMKSGEFSDLTIITKTKKIPAHKFILAAQSPVFAAMFRSKMQEAKNNSVEIKDFDENIVEAMIEYMYTGMTELSTHKVHSLDLLRISDKYELLDLKSSVAKFLNSSVKLENAVELLVLAFLHNCDALKLTAMDFINMNKAKLSGTEEFKKLGSGSHPQILKELFLSINMREMTERDSFKNLAISHPKILMDLYLAN